MKTKFINGISEIQTKYDAFFIDLWGVVHNGVKLNTDAIEVLNNLNKLKKRFVLLSNAPRPAKNVGDFLLKLNMKKNLIKNVFTSGEASLKSLQNEIYGKNFYHIGSKKDECLFKGFEKNKTKLIDADFILCTGLIESQENSLEYYKDLLKDKKNIKMICTNPDLVVFRGEKKEYCAGKVAEIFKELGGEVIYFGKPYPEIYKICMRKNEKVLVVGDNINTDIKGANNMKFDSLFIINGIHKKEFMDSSSKNYDKVFKKYGVEINYYQKSLSW